MAKTKAEVQAFINEWKALELKHGLELGGWCCYGPSVLTSPFGDELWTEEYGFAEGMLDESMVQEQVNNALNRRD